MDSSGASSKQTGSFQNQPPAERVKKRKRDMSCVLVDRSNLDEERAPRKSKREAVEKMSEGKQPKRPRGDSHLGSQRRWEKKDYSEKAATPDNPKPALTTLQKILKHDPDIVSRLSKYLDGYVERDICPETNKAMALKIFNTALTVWGDGIMDASRKAADVMGVSGETVRRWAADYYILLIDFDPSDIDDELIDEILESSRGKALKIPTV